MTATSVISVDGLTKNFGAAVKAVDDLTFEVEQGQVCGMLGPNGAGKTTTLRILLGLIQPSSGSTSLFGTRVTPSTPVLARVGTMIEQAAFVPYLTGMQNLKLWWKATGAHWPPPGIDRALDIAGLGAAVDRKVKTYSLGMHQRLGVARALMGNPDVLILDEPTVGLDPQEMRSLRQLLKVMAVEGVTVLLSSHLLGEVEEVCTDVVVMDRGRLIAAGSVTELMRTAASTAYFEVDDLAKARTVLSSMPGVRGVVDAAPGLAVDLDGEFTRARVVAALVQAGVGVETVMQRARLEDVFVGLVGEETTRH